MNRIADMRFSTFIQKDATEMRGLFGSKMIQ